MAKEKDKIETTTITEFRQNIKSYTDSIIMFNKVLVIPVVKTGVVVMSLDKYNSLVETAHLMSSEANVKRLRESIEQSK